MPMIPEELATCRNLLELLQDENVEVAQYWRMMLEHIDSQARQIKALKAGWIAERAAGICPIKDFTEGLADQIEIAQRQLAAEHPDLFQEGL